MQGFLLSLAHHLDAHNPGWRANYILVLDNCPSHKTSATLKLLEQLRFPTVFSAPASYAAIPVEELFGKIKCLNLDSKPEPDISSLGNPKISKLTLTQTAMLKISNYINQLQAD